MITPKKGFFLNLKIGLNNLNNLPVKTVSDGY